MLNDQAGHVELQVLKTKASLAVQADFKQMVGVKACGKEAELLELKQDLPADLQGELLWMQQGDGGKVLAEELVA